MSDRIDAVADAMKTVLLRNFDLSEFVGHLLIAEGTGIDLRELAEAAITALVDMP